MRREPLRGRARELALLTSALDGLADGQGSVAVVSGPAGIGKSALVEALARQAEARGHSVVRGRAWEFADAPPYFPVLPALRSVGVESVADANPFALWERVLGAMVRAGGPAVWVLEDLHAADLLSLDLLVFLSQPVRSMPVLVLVTARELDPRLDERAAQRLSRLAREGTDIRLSPLSSDDIAAIAEEVRGKPLAREERARFVARAEGNPLFALEMTRAHSSASDTSVPPTIRKLVQERVSRLPVAAQRVLSAGAILGREFGAGPVAHMLGTLPARAIDDLAPALAAGLVAETQPGVFVFGHVLERDAVEDGLTATERARLHAVAEAALAQIPPSPSILLERARHALLGGAVDDEARTLALVDAATTELERSGAFDRALSLRARLADARRSGLVKTPASPEELLSSAALARRAGQYASCRATCEDVMALARATGDGTLLARAALTAYGELRPGVVDPATVAALEEARAAVGDRDPKLACRIEARLAAALQPAPDPFAIAARARAAILAARETNDDELVAEVLVTAGSALIDYAPADERRAMARELVDLTERLGDREKLLRARGRLAFDVLELGDFDGFDAEVERMLELSMDLGQPRHRFRPLLFASMRACMRGRFQDSERCLVEVDQLAALTDDPELALSIGAHRGRRAADTEPAETLISSSPMIVQSLQGVPVAHLIGAILRAGLFARAGDRARAEREMSQVEKSLPVVLDDIGFTYLSVEPAAFGGSPRLCAALRERILPNSGLEVISGHVPVTYEGPVLRMLALLDAALGDAARAEERAEQALSHVRRHGLWPWVARISAELAAMLERRGVTARARTLFDESAALATELGMPALAHRAGARVGAADASADLGLERRGDTYRVFGGRHDVTVRDNRGMRLLERLVEQRGRELHVLLLASDEATAVRESDAGDQIDEAALRAYKARLGELETELQEAEAHRDLGRAERLRAERSAIEGEVRAAVGLSGRARKAGSVTERARVNVQRRLKDALTKISDADPELGRRFAAAVRTGTYCSFRP